MTRTRIHAFCMASIALLAVAGVVAGAQGIDCEAMARAEVVQTQGAAQRPTAILQSVKEGDFTSLVREILIAAGQPSVLIRIRSADDIKTMGASIEGDRKIIDYNPTFTSQLAALAETDWAVVLVLAHEVAHHLSGDAVPKVGRSRDDRDKEELAADHDAGFLMARLGAPLPESLRSLKAGCQLMSIDAAHCAVFENAVRDGWLAGAKAG